LATARCAGSEFDRGDLLDAQRQGERPARAISRLGQFWEAVLCGLLTVFVRSPPPQQQQQPCHGTGSRRVLGRFTLRKSWRTTLARKPGCALAVSQPQEKPDIGWAAIATASSQESRFWMDREEYIIVPVLIHTRFIIPH
jgi:hypothetical protein